LALLIRISLSLALAAVVAAGATGAWTWRWMHHPVAIGESVTFEIARGANFRSFASDLAAAGIIEHPELFRLYARATGLATEVRAGEYEIEPGRSRLELLDQVVSGRVKLYSLTIVEGWAVARMLQELSRRDELVQTVTHLDAASLMPALGLEGEHAEGWFFPDTYRFPRGTADAAVLVQAHRRMQQELDRAWARRSTGLPLNDPYEALILASVIEKETGHADERAKVSQVFNSRLAAGMRLQTDPTVIYGFGDSFEGRLRRIHLDTDHPYNTYRHGGLPPTPIALPGRPSLNAAVQPAATDYLYFVARGDGTSEFTTNLDDHVAAVRRFQLGLEPQP
jgi:UPF0755 protein